MSFNNGASASGTTASEVKKARSVHVGDSKARLETAARKGRGFGRRQCHPGLNAGAAVSGVPQGGVLCPRRFNVKAATLRLRRRSALCPVCSADHGDRARRAEKCFLFFSSYRGSGVLIGVRQGGWAVVVWRPAAAAPSRFGAGEWKRICAAHLDKRGDYYGEHPPVRIRAGGSRWIPIWTQRNNFSGALPGICVGQPPSLYHTCRWPSMNSFGFAARPGVRRWLRGRRKRTAAEAPRRRRRTERRGLIFNPLPACPGWGYNPAFGEGFLPLLWPPRITGGAR